MSERFRLARYRTHPERCPAPQVGFSACKVGWYLPRSGWVQLRKARNERLVGRGNRANARGKRHNRGQGRGRAEGLAGLLERREVAEDVSAETG